MPANIVKARFRIANWGSAVGDLTASSWSDIPGLASVTDAVGIPANGTGNITGAWTLTHAERCRFGGKAGVPTANPPIPPIRPARTKIRSWSFINAYSCRCPGRV